MLPVCLLWVSVNCGQWNSTRFYFCDSTEIKLVLLLSVCQAWSYLGGPRRWNQEEIAKHCTRQSKRTSRSGLSCWWGRGWIFWWTVLATDIGCLKYLTYLWCWAYPKVPDLLELHCNCDTGMLILTWQLLGVIQEKKPDCTCHLQTSLVFISYLVGPSSRPCLSRRGKIWGKFLPKAQFKRNPNPRSTEVGRVVKNIQMLAFSSWHLLVLVICLWLFSELNSQMNDHIFISYLTPLKAGSVRQDFSLV